MAGYSDTPLIKKIGIKPGHRVGLLQAPAGFGRELGELPEGARITTNELDVAILFAKNTGALNSKLTRAAWKIKADGMLWVAWPKKASGVTTDLSFDVVQKAGLALGLVDTKICAVNEVWSGLKFVYRVKDRVTSQSSAKAGARRRGTGTARSFDSPSPPAERAQTRARARSG
jgi:hypothetical protein